MKRLLLILFAGLLVQTSIAQSQCNPSFTTTPMSVGNSLLLLQLNNTSNVPTGNKIYSWQLNWGDGSSPYYIGTGNSYHNYTSPGSYVISMIMTVWDSVGGTTVLNCRDTVRDTVNMAYTPCGSTFTISNTSGSSLVVVTATTPAGSSGVTYTWNWGDGTPNTTGNPATHTYATNGQKAITLIATKGSCSHQNIDSAYIGNMCSGLSANFSYQVNGPAVNFTATTTGNPSKLYPKYNWNFGDGSGSYNNTSPYKSHTYANSGNYTVQLIVRWTDSAGTSSPCGDTIIKSVSVVNTNIISGLIGQDSSSSIANIDSPIYKVWLITFDSATNILAAVDSTVVNGTNWYATPYQFLNKAAGTYRVKAHLLNGPTSGPGWVPTYHYSSLMWNTATTFVHTGGSSINKYIMVKAGTATSGPGFIGGNVTQGANKGTGSGIEGITVFLLDASGNMITADVTDANGGYSFNNLPPANYTIYPENLGYATTPASVSIVNGKPNITGINFERSHSNKTITPVATAIANVDNSALGFAIYPNPAKDRITIQWNDQLSNVADVTLTDVTGKKVFTTTVSGNGNAVLNLGELTKGMYFITISSDNVQETKKLLLQ